LLVDEGLLTPAELELGLDEQRRTGRLLGQILVNRGYLSGFSLARVLSEQHGVQLGTAAEPEEPAPVIRAAPNTTWRPLGKVLVDGGFVGQSDLDSAVADQPADRRLGEFLVERGLLSGADLGRALAEQHGIDLAWLSEPNIDVETALRPTQAQDQDPVYRVYAVAFRHGFQDRKFVSESANFLEAADFAMEFVQEHDPEGLEIDRVEGVKSETVWNYSESRAAAATAKRPDLVDTFGFDPIKWRVDR
jgi:hypothetical protein